MTTTKMRKIAEETKASERGKVGVQALIEAAVVTMTTMMTTLMTIDAGIVVPEIGTVGETRIESEIGPVETENAEMDEVAMMTTTTKIWKTTLAAVAAIVKETGEGVTTGLTGIGTETVGIGVVLTETEDTIAVSATIDATEREGPEGRTEIESMTVNAVAGETPVIGIPAVGMSTETEIEMITIGHAEGEAVIGMTETGIGTATTRETEMVVEEVEVVIDGKLPLERAMTSIATVKEIEIERWAYRLRGPLFQHLLPLICQTCGPSLRHPFLELLASCSATSAVIRAERINYSPSTCYTSRTATAS
jgi:hypothetical protein